jgi:hypothetical protein
MNTETLPPSAEINLSTGIRRQQVACFTAEYCSGHYTTDGEWRATPDMPAPDARKTLWLCFGLFANDGCGSDATAAHALANAILARLEQDPHIKARTPEEAASQFDIFVTNHAMQMLVVHGDKLTEFVRHKLEGWARDVLNDYPGDRQADYQFHGANDNMPAKATLGMILGGEYFGDDEAVAHGLWNLRQLRDLLTRRGLLSEYTSPTYSPLTLVNLAEISQHARHPEAIALASQCTERIWADILGHFHVPTRTMGGAYSRAYQLDSTAQFSTISCLLWLSLGDEWTAFNPVVELQRDLVRLVHHHDDRTTQLGVLAWLTSCVPTPPQHLLRWVETRRYPFRLRADAERCGPEAAVVNTSFYAEQDFALGTSIGEPWTALQSEAFFIQYRRRAHVADVADIRTVYARYLIDGQSPGNDVEAHLLKPHALVHTIHKDRVALVLARPLERLAGQSVKELKLSVIIPTHFGALEHIEIVPGETRGPCAHHVFIKDGPLYLALRGLHATRWGNDSAEADQTGIRLEPTSDGDYQVVSFFNYNGVGRKFAQEEITRTLNGFVSVVGLASEETFAEFKQRVTAARLLDYYAFDQRTVTYEIDKVAGCATRLSASYAMPTNCFRYVTIDGQPMPRPRWQADGLSESHVPFLNGAEAGAGWNPLADFPHKHMRVVWAPEKPWQISSPVT